MGETQRQHLLLYPFSDQKPNICCHRCSISNQLKTGRYIRPFIKSWWRCTSVNVETNSHFLQSIIVFGFDDFLFYWFLCFMDYPWFTLGLINLWIQIYSNQFLFKIILDNVFSFSWSLCFMHSPKISTKFTLRIFEFEVAKEAVGHESLWRLGC